MMQYFHTVTFALVVAFREKLRRNLQLLDPLQAKEYPTPGFSPLGS